MYDFLKKKKEEKPKKTVNQILNIFRVDSEQQESRFNICKSCEHFIPITTTCTKCGCFTNMKTWMKNQSCPIGKWK
jgi:hypothetical protein